MLKELRESKPIIEPEGNNQQFAFYPPPKSPRRKKEKYVRKKLPIKPQSDEQEPDQSLNGSI